ncbi:unnamed protein product [Toxocara canis]|uniref:Mur_ligase_M domain-containing protein n=1 Tax=Toxocara canis TaxID=6265 RepID=A0A183VCU2_TOXCA|nr:unnamed protein product [Toxocara canis]
MGKVIEILRTSDEQVRSAVLKTSTCQRLEWPVDKLYPSEIPMPEANHDEEPQTLGGHPPNRETTASTNLHSQEIKTPEQSSDEGTNADSNLPSEGRQPDEWQRGRQPQGYQYVKHPGDENLQAEQEEMPVEKSVVAMKGTTPGKERNIPYNTLKERNEGVRKGTSGKTTIAAVFVTLLRLSVLSTAGGQSTCDG